MAVLHLGSGRYGSLEQKERLMRTQEQHAPKHTPHDTPQVPLQTLGRRVEWSGGE